MLRGDARKKERLRQQEVIAAIVSRDREMAEERTYSRSGKHDPDMDDRIYRRNFYDKVLEEADRREKRGDKDALSRSFDKAERIEADRRESNDSVYFTERNSKRAKERAEAEKREASRKEYDYLRRTGPIPVSYRDVLRAETMRIPNQRNVIDGMALEDGTYEDRDDEGIDASFWADRVHTARHFASRRKHAAQLEYNYNEMNGIRHEYDKRDEEEADKEDRYRYKRTTGPFRNFDLDEAYYDMWRF